MYFFRIRRFRNYLNCMLTLMQDKKPAFYMSVFEPYINYEIEK